MVTRIKVATSNWHEDEAKDRVIVEHFANLFIEQDTTTPRGVLDAL